MNINQFKSTMNRFGGLARTNLFMVELFPNHSGSMPNANPAALRFFCKAATIPGINLTVSEHKPYAVGLPQLSPTGMTAPHVNCIFMLDDNHQVLTFFHQWMQTIYNYDVSGGITRENRVGMAPYEIGYRSEYGMDMTIKLFSAHNPNNYYECHLHSVFPTEISDVNLSWEDEAQVAVMTVNFSYASIKMQGTRTSTGPLEQSRGLRGVDHYASVGSTVIPVESFAGAASVNEIVNRLTASNGNMIRFF